MNPEHNIHKLLRFDFVRIPKTLFRSPQYKPLSPLAILLYGILLDRLCLSLSNGAPWQDENGDSFVYCTLEEITERLKCGHDKAGALIKELEACGLLRKKKQGLGKPNRLFIRPFVTDSDFGKTEIKTSKNPNPRLLKIRSPYSQKTDVLTSEKSKEIILIIIILIIIILMIIILTQ